MARGGPRPGAGRKKGKVSQARRDLAEMAREHAPAALQTLMEVATGDGPESARVSAATAILDRAYGRPPQALEHSAKSLDDELAEMLDRVSGNAFRPQV